MLRGANGIVIIKGIYKTCCQGAGLTQFSLGINLLKTGDESLHRTHLILHRLYLRLLALGGSLPWGTFLFLCLCAHVICACVFISWERVPFTGISSPPQKVRHSR